LIDFIEVNLRNLVYSLETELNFSIALNAIYLPPFLSWFCVIYNNWC